MYACGCLLLQGDWARSMAEPSAMPAAALQGQARACCNLGVIYFKQQQYHEAVSHFEKFFEKARGLHNQQTLDIARTNLGAARAAVKFESYSQASLPGTVYDSSVTLHSRRSIPCRSPGMQSAGHCLPDTLSGVSSPIHSNFMLCCRLWPRTSPHYSSGRPSRCRLTAQKCCPTDLPCTHLPCQAALKYVQLHSIETA